MYLLRIFSLVVLMSTLCAAQQVGLQVLGSGGPEMDDGRASTSYLVFVDGKARVLVDAGPGSALNFEKTEAKLEDLDIILLSHLHVDHCADLPAYVKALFFSERRRPLLVAGPTSGRWFPTTKQFIESLFSEVGSAYPYLSDYLSPTHSPQLVAVNAGHKWKHRVSADLRVRASRVMHGPVPSLAWRLEIGEKVLVFSGDFNGRSGHVEELAKGADLLVCHNAVPESAQGLARRLHATPSVIGGVAGKANPKQLLLSHRMLRTLGSEGETLRLIRKSYTGPVRFAEDLDLVDL